MFFDIYIRKTGENPDIDMWTTVSIRDFISTAKKVDEALSKASIDVEPDIVLEMPDNTKKYVGDVIKVTFRSLELSKEEFEFLRSITEDQIDVIFLDVAGNIVYGCKKVRLGVEPVLVDQSKLIHIAGSRKGIENLIYYRITAYQIAITYPQRGYIYNSLISEVHGIIA